MTWTADSGGKAVAVLQPVTGARRVADLLLGLRRRLSEVRIEAVNCNHTPAIMMRRDEQIDGVLLIEVAQGRIGNFYTIRNPDKLATVTVPRRISR